MTLAKLKKFAMKVPGLSLARRAGRYGISYSSYLKDFYRFSRLSSSTDSRFMPRWNERFPCVEDKKSTVGFDRHYVYHIGWAARVLARTKPLEHVDISSIVDFCSVISAFIPTRYYEFRFSDLKLDGLVVEPADLLALPFEDRSVHSLSCMHVVEHAGLGRYGDRLDPDGDLKAISELKRVLERRGSLLFVVPVGRPRMMFNAHRIYSYKQILKYFEGLELKEFSLIPDDPAQGGVILNATEQLADSQNYGCGCFWFVRGQA